MSGITWTAAELAEFDDLTYASCSHNQGERIRGRIHMQAFIREHGKEKCDAMWRHLMEKEGKKP